MENADEGLELAKQRLSEFPPGEDDFDEDDAEGNDAAAADEEADEWA